MKQRVQGIIAGFLAGAVCIGAAAWAKTATETIEVSYDNIKVYKDNVLCELKDANGGTIEPFIYNGTTYLPVRGAATLADMQVTWDGATRSVYLWDEMSEDGNLYAMDVCPPYEKANSYKAYTASEGTSFTMANQKYTNGFTLGYSMYDTSGYAYFNLNGKYSSMELVLGHIDGTYNSDKNIQFFLDDKLVYEYEVSSSNLPKTISIPLNYGLQLRIVTTNRDGRTGFGNIILKN